MCYSTQKMKISKELILDELRMFVIENSIVKKILIQTVYPNENDALYAQLISHCVLLCE